MTSNSNTESLVEPALCSPLYTPSWFLNNPEPSKTVLFLSEASPVHYQEGSRLFQNGIALSYSVFLSLIMSFTLTAQIVGVMKEIPIYE